VRAWLLGAFAEPPSKAETEMLADAAWLCLRANGDAKPPPGNSSS
jgi:hypothetical protein